MLDLLQNDLNICNITLACYVPAGSGDTIHKNRPSHGLAFKCFGSSDYIFSNGKVISIKKNDIIYLPKNSDYSVTKIVSGDCFAISFDLSDNVIFKPFAISTKDSQKFFELFKSAEKIWRSKKHGYNLKCKALLYEIIYNMQKEYNYDYLNGQKAEIIKPAVSYIHKKYHCEELKISALAEMCNITPEYFRKIFSSVYGSSPAKYIINLKLERSRELLSSGLYTVTEAMLLSGYTDAAYFSHQFKNKYGYSPQKAKHID